MALALTITQMGVRPAPTSRITVASAGESAPGSSPGQHPRRHAADQRPGGSALSPEAGWLPGTRLAASAPVLSDGGRTVTVPLRTDVRFTMERRSMPQPWPSACGASRSNPRLCGGRSDCGGGGSRQPHPAAAPQSPLHIPAGPADVDQPHPDLTNGLQQPSGPFSARPLCGDRPLQTDPLQRTSATLGALCPVLG